MHSDDRRTDLPLVADLSPEELIANLITSDGKGRRYQKECMLEVLRLIDDYPNKYLQLFDKLVAER